MKNRVYLSPMNKVDFLEKKHPYIFNLYNAIKRDFVIVNEGQKDNLHFLSSIKYKKDIVYLNWIEDIHQTKFGVVGWLLCYMLILYYKLVKIHIVWTHHNVHSHQGPNFLNSISTKFLFKFSDTIIIHTKESLSIIPEKYHYKAKYYFHPIFKTESSSQIQVGKDIDILIWGNIRPSKGVLEFLEFMQTKNKLSSYKILVVGKITDSYLEKALLNFQSERCIIQNRYVGDEELSILHARSRYVLLSYIGTSVLNSGVLVKSVSLGGTIIGPDKAAFRDLEQLGLIFTFVKFDDLLEVLDNNIEIRPEKVKEFCYQNTWDNFSSFLKKELLKNNK